MPLRSWQPDQHGAEVILMPPTGAAGAIAVGSWAKQHHRHQYAARPGVKAYVRAAGEVRIGDWRAAGARAAPSAGAIGARGFGRHRLHDAHQRGGSRFRRVTVPLHDPQAAISAALTGDD